jgi:predicted nucleotidyltransferase
LEETMKKPKLSPDDQAWLDSYRSAIAARFGPLVSSIIVFGSKARGDSTADSDLDLLLVIEEGDWRLKSKLADAAYELAIGTDVVPSVKIYTRAEWEQLQENESIFRETVTREGLLVA